MVLPVATLSMIPMGIDWIEVPPADAIDSLKAAGFQISLWLPSVSRGTRVKSPPIEGATRTVDAEPRTCGSRLRSRSSSVAAAIASRC
jgi:hypothetical protein